MDIEKGTKVKLTVDLTQYAKGLVAGAEGSLPVSKECGAEEATGLSRSVSPGLPHWMYCGIRWKLLMKKY